MHLLLEQLTEAEKELLAKHPVESLPTVGLVIHARHPRNASLLIDNIRKQTVKPSKVVILVETYDPQDVAYLKQFLDMEFLIKERDTNLSISGVYGYGVGLLDTPYVALMTDTDRYQPSYLHGKLARLVEDEAVLVTGFPTVAYFPAYDTTTFVERDIIHPYKPANYFASAVLRLDAFLGTSGFSNQGAHVFVSDFAEAIKRLELGKVVTNAPFNFLRVSHAAYSRVDVGGFEAPPFWDLVKNAEGVELNPV